MCLYIHVLIHAVNRLLGHNVWFSMYIYCISLWIYCIIMCSHNGHRVALLFKLPVKISLWKKERPLWVLRKLDNFCDSIWGYLSQYSIVIVGWWHIHKDRTLTGRLWQRWSWQQVIMTDNLQKIITGLGESRVHTEVMVLLSSRHVRHQKRCHVCFSG